MAASALGKNLKNFTINYDLSKYLMTSDVARKQSENLI